MSTLHNDMSNDLQREVYQTKEIDRMRERLTTCSSQSADWLGHRQPTSPPTISSARDHEHTTCSEPPPASVSRETVPATPQSSAHRQPSRPRRVARSRVY